VKIFPFAMNAIGCTAMRMVSEWKERRDIVISNQPDVTTVSPVATIWPSIDDGSFAPE